MHRGNPNRGGGQFRGRGRGEGGRGRGGRGRGGGGGGWKPRGRGMGSSFLDDELDFSIHMYADTQPNRGGSPAYRGNRGSGSGYSTPTRGRGGGGDSPYRARGRGGGIGSPNRGRGGQGRSKLRPDGPLSGLLYQERPLLKPIVFVPSVHTKTLFQQEEEILKSVVEEVGEGYEKHAPTADRVARIFSGRFPRPDSVDGDGGGNTNDDDEELEEVDFADLSKLLETPAHEPKRKSAEEQFTGVFISESPIPLPQTQQDQVQEEQLEEIDFSQLHKLVDNIVPSAHQQETENALLEVEERFTGFVIDTQPSAVSPAARFSSSPAEAQTSVESGKKKKARRKKKKKSPLSTSNGVAKDTPMDDEEDEEEGIKEIDAMVVQESVAVEAPAEVASRMAFIDPAIVIAVREPTVAPPPPPVVEMASRVPVAAEDISTECLAQGSEKVEHPQPADDMVVEETIITREAEVEEVGHALVVSESVMIGDEASSAPTVSVSETSVKVPIPTSAEVPESEEPKPGSSFEDTVMATVEGQPAFPVNTQFASVADSEVVEEVSTGVEEPAGVPVQEAKENIVVEEQPTFFIDTEPTLIPSQGGEETTVEEQTFFIDTQPTPVPLAHALAAPKSPAEDEEIIVYVAPHPRSSRVSEAEEKEGPTFSPYVRNESFAAASTSISVSAPSTSTGPTAPPISSLNFSFSPVKQSFNRKQNPVRTPRAAKARKAYERKVAKRAKRAASGTFANYGAMMEEAALREGRDKRWKERRRGDSDLEWGSGNDDEQDEEDEEDVFAAIEGKGKGKARENGMAAEGMDVDPELELDVDAMKRFASGFLGGGAGQFMTMDDVRDEEKMREEDEEMLRRGSSGEEDEDEDEDGDEGDEGDKRSDKEVEAIFNVEEKVLIGEVDVEEGEERDEDEEDEDEDDDDDDDDIDDSDDEENTPHRGFQARLEHLRQKARERKADTSFEGETHEDEDDDEDDEDMLERHMTWAEMDNKFIDEIEDMLAENEDILTGRDRKARKVLFNAIRDGEFDAMDTFGTPARRRRDMWKDYPVELQDQWEKDRQKKAERRRARELEKLQRAADGLSLKKGGKKGRKAMMAASRLDPTITVLPNRIIDMTTLVQQIRRFISQLDGPPSMALPPTNKETRKNIHEMADAFGLKSVSKGKGDARYTTLLKTSRTGVAVNEKKVSWIVRRSGGAGARGSQFVYTESSTKRGAKVVLPRHKEGDEVGKAAPKIDQSNVGFRMLASMGWSEGDRIGMSGGLDAPITAIIKHTKLGLGATR